MKIILIAVLLFCSTSFKQDEPLSKIANISLPGNAVRMSKEGALSYSKKHFRYTNAMAEYDHVLNIENIIVGFKDYDKKNVNVNLDERRREWIGVAGETRPRLSYVRSDIVNVNHSQYLIVGAVNGEDGTYTAISEPKGSKGVMIKIRFKTEDREKANKLITDILNKISFKAASLTPEQ